MSNALPDETTKRGRKKKEQAIQGMAEIEKLLAVQATHAAAAAPIGTGAPRISTRSELFAVGDQRLPDPLELIVVAQALQNVWYDTEYDPDDRQPPACFALAPVKEFDETMRVVPGTGEEALRAHETSPNRQGGKNDHDCTTCAKNQFGSAERGKGKACANSIQLAVVLANDPALTNEGELRYATLGLSATALGPWGKYVKALSEVLKRPPHGVITSFTFNKNDKDERRRKAVIAGGHRIISDPHVLRKVMALHDTIRNGKDLLRPLSIAAPEQNAKPVKAAKSGKKKDARPAARF